jgi:sirohydrochlorin ferrochelatase
MNLPSPLRWPRWLPALAIGLCTATAGVNAQPSPTTRAAASDTAYLAVAADRGFQGNEEIRDALDGFAAGRPAELVIATDDRTKGTLDAAVGRLAASGAKRLVVLPVFMSGADAKWQQVKPLLAKGPLPAELAQPFGDSYFAVEALAEQLRAVHHPQQARVVVVGYATEASAAARRAVAQDWQRIAQQASEGFGFAQVQTVVWTDARGGEREALRAASRKALQDAAAAGGEGRVVVVPFHFGRRLDGMMSFDAELKSELPKGAELLQSRRGPEQWLATWMAREANRHATLAANELGVILLAHGSDYQWNETMRQAVAPLESRYPMEYVFSMADQPLVERAVRRLEKRGARAAVIVRVFGLESSFKSDVERMIGSDVESAAAPSSGHSHGGHGSHGGGHGGGHGGDHDGHGAHDAAYPPARISTPLALTTVGGVEAAPLFAATLLERARALSRDPRKETVILVAHGTGSDQRNEQWVGILEQLAAQMKSAPGAPAFRAIRHATWREDWPDKRAPWIQRVRDMVQEAGKDGGRAIVIPARTNGTGPERRFLEGLSFELGEGFAPHPLFTRWFEQQVQAGAAALNGAAASR